MSQSTNSFHSFLKLPVFAKLWLKLRRWRGRLQCFWVALKLKWVSKFKDNTGRLLTMQCKERGGTERKMDCFDQSFFLFFFLKVHPENIKKILTFLLHCLLTIHHLHNHVPDFPVNDVWVCLRVKHVLRYCWEKFWDNIYNILLNPILGKFKLFV